MKKRHVAITFDFDALSVWIGSYKMSNASALSRGEFAVPAVHRILKLLQDFEISATFFVPGHTALAYPHAVQAVISSGHEIGHHGFVHERLSELSADQERAVLEAGLRALEDQQGVRPVGYRSPSWEFTDVTAGLLLEYGFEYDSSLMGSDFAPYWVRSGDRFSPDGPYVFGEETSIVELPVSWILDDFPHFEYVRGILPTMKAPSQVFEIWRGEFDYFIQETTGGCFTLTLHPQCIGRGHRITMLRKLLAHMRGSGVEFTTLRAAAAEWRSAEPAGLDS